MAPILGLSKWRTPAEVYADKRGELPDNEPTVDMLIGTRLEQPMFELYRKTNPNLARVPEMIRDQDFEILIANIDALEYGVEDRIVEFKTARDDSSWGEPGTDDVPLEYSLQVQHYMSVARVGVADILVLFKNKRKIELVKYTVEADSKLQHAIRTRLLDFWHCHVLTGIPPEPTNVEEAQARWKKSVPCEVIASPTIIDTMTELHAVRARLKELETLEASLKFLAMQAMGEADTLKTPTGTILATWKTAKAARKIDVSLLREAFPQIAAKVETTGEPVRKFLVKGEK